MERLGAGLHVRLDYFEGLADVEREVPDVSGLRCEAEGFN
jgi:hypothetical protein